MSTALSDALLREAARCGARVMHTADQHEVVCFRPEALAEFVVAEELRAIHDYAELSCDANAVGLTLRANRMQYLLREHRDSQVYAACASLRGVEEALARRRQETQAPGRLTRFLQSVLSGWGR